MKHLAVPLAACAVLGGAMTASAQCTFDKIVSPHGSAGDTFLSHDVAGNTLVAGSFLDDRHGTNAGAAFVFRFATGAWTVEAELIPADLAAGDYLGWSAAIDGDYAVVGAPQSSSTGAAYVFHHDNGTWTETAKLLPSNGSTGDWFGRVSIDGDYILVGAHDDEGKAYVFHRTGTVWAEEAILVPSATSSGDNFGSGVSLAGDVALVGARYEDTAASNAGSAFVFRRTGSTWTEETQLTAGDANPDDAFGWYVGIDGAHAVIGASLADERGTDAGAAYVFEYSGGISWTQTAKLLGSQTSAGDRFGTVAIDEDVILVGARYEDAAAAESGAAYLFRKIAGTWTETLRCFPADGVTGDNFGTVAMDGAFAAFGAPLDDDLGTDSGSAYVFATRPQADFAGTPLVGEVPLAVQFTDLSSGEILTWSWDFGDGETSDEAAPSHTYVANGTYTVSLTVSGPQGDDDETKADYILVVGGPAGAVFRNDSADSNTTGYAAWPPILGGQWQAFVSNHGTNNTAALVVGYAGAIEYFVAGMDDYLLVNVGDSSGELLGLTLAPGTGFVTFAVSIPDDLNLSGIALFTQGVGLGGGPTTLHNAYDLVLGTY